MLNSEEPSLELPPQSSDDEQQDVAPEVEDTTEPLVNESIEFIFDDLDSIDMDSIPESARSYVAPILDHVKHLTDGIEAERASYEEVKEQFQTLMETIDEAAKGNIEPIVQEYQAVQGAFTQMSTENVDLAHRLFNLEYPNYEQQEAHVKKAFADALVHPQFNDRFDGENLYDKMVDAYKLTLYRGGVSSSPRPQKQQVVLETTPPVKTPPSRNVVKQTLVSGGQLAPNMPSINLEEMSFDDILSRGEHLLDN